jgi:hypothetical protein
MLAWTLAILFLSAMAIFSWLFPAYVFRNPEVPSNYALLRKLGKLENVKAFSRERRLENSGDFYGAVKLFERESGRSEGYLTGFNNIQKRLYVQNYEQGKMFGYVTGMFDVVTVRALGDDDFFEGVAIQATSVDFPNLVLEYLLPVSMELLPFKAGSKLRIGKGDDKAAILHMDRLSGDRLSVSVVPLTYHVKLPDGSSLDAAPPKALNLRSKWPVFGEGMIAESSG